VCSFFRLFATIDPRGYTKYLNPRGLAIAVGGVEKSYSYTQREYHGVRGYGHLIEVKSQKINRPKRKIIKRNKFLWQKLIAKLHLTDVQVAVYYLEILYKIFIIYLYIVYQVYNKQYMYIIY